MKSADELQAILEDMPKRMGVPDPSWFVGRRLSCKNLLGNLCGKQTGAVWLHGPRRIGKTSLADWLETSQELDVVRVTPRPETGTADDLVKLIGRALKQHPSGLVLTAWTCDGLHQLAKGLERPLVVVVDEFDPLALGLSKDDQARLRSLSHDHDRFGWVFLTRSQPSDLCHYYDERSWLVGICLVEGMVFLEEEDVLELSERLAERAGWDDDEDIARAIYGRVGGFPVAVVELLRTVVLSRLDRVERGKAPHPLERDLGNKVKQGLRDQLRSLWKDLPYSVRGAVLAEEGDPAAEELLLDWASIDEDERPCRPTWLAELGRELGMVPTATPNGGLVDRAADLGDRIKFCNDLSQRLQLPRFFQAGDRFPELVKLAREVRSADELRSVIRLLHQLLIEAMPEDPGNTVKDARQKAYRRARASAGFSALVLLRNHEFHDPGQRRNDQQCGSAQEKVGKTLARYLDGRVIAAGVADYQAIQAGLLGDLVEGLTAIGAALESA